MKVFVKRLPCPASKAEDPPSRSKLNVLLQRLALPGNKYYALMSENELAIEQLKTEIISCNMRRDSREGLRKLQSLSELVDADDHLTKQFILRSKVLLGKEEKGEIVPYCFEEKLDLLYQAIRLTIPAFDINEIGKHWYSLDEMKIINQIGITYGEHQQELQAIDIYYQFLKYIQKSKFQINNDNVPVAILVAYNYSLLLCKKQHYKRRWKSPIGAGTWRFTGADPLMSVDCCMFWVSLPTN